MTFLDAGTGHEPAGTSPAPGRKLVRIAHRAGNDRLLLRRAIDARVDWIELDVWYSYGRLFAHHERGVWRLPVVYDKWHVRLLRERPIDLAEVIRLTDPGIGLFIDLKGFHRRLPGAIIETLRRKGALERAIVCGQHWPALDAIARAEPAVRVFHSLGRPEHIIAYQGRSADMPRAAGLSVAKWLITPALVDRWARMGLQTFAWTVNEQGFADQLAGWGVHGIISDQLDLLATLP